MGYSLNANYDVALSVDLAGLSLAAYSTGAELRTEVASLGWTFVQELHASSIVPIIDANAVILERTLDGKHEMAIAFRGTAGFADLLTDLVSYGFTDYYKALRPQIEAAVVRAVHSRYDNIYITGHSLGGAATQIAMIDMLEPATLPVWTGLFDQDDPLRVGDRFLDSNPGAFDTNDWTWLRGHLYGVTFGAPSISIDSPSVVVAVETTSLNPAFALDKYKDLLFQYEHKSHTLLLPDDPIASLASGNTDRGDELGSLVAIELDSGTGARYAELARLGYVFDLHAMGAYYESMLRLLSDAPLLAAGNDSAYLPSLPESFYGSAGHDAIVNAENAQGFGGNDILVATNRNVLTMNGGPDHDAYIIGAYGINVTLDGPADEHLDALYFTVAGTVIPQAIADDSEALVLKIVNGANSSTITIPHWYSALGNYQLAEIGQINPDVPNNFWSYVRLFNNDTSRIPLFNNGTVSSDVIIGSLSNDTITGGPGDDVLSGRAGSDTLTGSAGSDTFKFAASDKDVDTITDFGLGDKIQIMGFAPAVSQTFALGDGSTVTGSRVQVSNGAGLTTLSVDTDNVAGADVRIVLHGTYLPGSFGVDAGGAIVLNEAGAGVNTAPSFAPPNGRGIVTVGFGQQNDQAYSVALQPNGQIVVVGSSNSDFAVVRLNVDGSLDASFGADGGVTTSIGSGSDVAKAVALQEDGKVLVMGDSQGAQYSSVALVRYNVDGGLDADFGTNHKSTLTSPNADIRGADIAVQPDGNIIVAGYGGIYSQNYSYSQDLIVARFGSDGNADLTFNNGYRAIDLGGAYDYTGQTTDAGGYVATQTDGKIIVAGSATFSFGSTAFALLRLNSDGSPDPTFGIGGKSLMYFGTGNGFGGYQSSIVGMEVQADDRIVAYGYELDGITTSYIAVRFNADGSLDKSYGTNGVAPAPAVVSNASGAGTRWHSALLLDDARIILVGDDFNGINWDFFVARYRSNGSLDPTFGSTAVSTLGGTVAYTGGASPVVLDPNVAVFDEALSAQGNYSGASLALRRSGVANTQDLFSASGSLSFSENDLSVSGTVIGTVNQSGGELNLTFNVNATQALVNYALQHIAYSNAGNSAASISLIWTFSDGNSGAQGSGGAAVATGSTVIEVTAQPTGHTIEFLVYSWKAHTLLEGVSITTGISVASQPTGTDGSASFTGITDTSLALDAERVIPASETSLTDQAVNLQDAIAILKMIVGLSVNGAGNKLSPYQTLAADFDANGHIQLTDAIGVLKHVVGLPAPDPVWRFASETDSSIPQIAGLSPGAAPAISLDLSGTTPPAQVGLVAYLSGDVDGSYAGASGSLDLDESQPGYFTALTQSHGLDPAQFGMYS